jgi:hypothetical protein
MNCDICGKEITVADGVGTGYGIDQEGHMVCYPCCAEQDKKQMVETGRIVLYLTILDSPNKQRVGTSWVSIHGKVTNWPGSLEFPCNVRTGRHNWGLERHDAWFKAPDGFIWHGVQIGSNSQLCFCTRTKEIWDEDKKPVRVIFRKWLRVGCEGCIIAFFPDIEASRGYMQSYEHIGQHGGAAYRGLLGETKLATPEEYADLKAELEGIGYNLKVSKRYQRR